MNDSKRRLPVLILTLLFFAANLGLFYFQSWGDWLLNRVQLPRVNRILRQGEFSTLSLKDIFTYTFALPTDIQRRIAPVAGGIFIGLLFILLIWVVYRSIVHKGGTGNHSFVHGMLAGFLLIGTVFPAVFDKRPGEEQCSTNFLAYYDEAGRSFANLLPPQSVVYWKGSGRHLAFMLYVDDVKLFLPQIHAGGGYVTGDDTQDLLRLGLYDEELDTQWRESADILVYWPTYVTKEVRDFLDQPAYERLPFDMGKLARCEDELLVYRKTS